MEGKSQEQEPSSKGKILTRLGLIFTQTLLDYIYVFFMTFSIQGIRGVMVFFLLFYPLLSIAIWICILGFIDLKYNQEQFRTMKDLFRYKWKQNIQIGVAFGVFQLFNVLPFYIYIKIYKKYHAIFTDQLIDLLEMDRQNKRLQLAFNVDEDKSIVTYKTIDMNQMPNGNAPPTPNERLNTSSNNNHNQSINTNHQNNSNNSNKLKNNNNNKDQNNINMNQNMTNAKMITTGTAITTNFIQNNTNTSMQGKQPTSSTKLTQFNRISTLAAPQQLRKEKSTSVNTIPIGGIAVKSAKVLQGKSTAKTVKNGRAQTYLKPNEIVPPDSTRRELLPINTPKMFSQNQITGQLTTLVNIPLGIATDNGENNNNNLSDQLNLSQLRRKNTIPMPSLANISRGNIFNFNNNLVQSKVEGYQYNFEQNLKTQIAIVANSKFKLFSVIDESNFKMVFETGEILEIAFKSLPMIAIQLCNNMTLNNWLVYWFTIIYSLVLLVRLCVVAQGFIGLMLVNERLQKFLENIRYFNDEIHHLESQMQLPGGTLPTGTTLPTTKVEKIWVCYPMPELLEINQLQTLNKITHLSATASKTVKNIIIAINNSPSYATLILQGIHAAIQTFQHLTKITLNLQQ